MGRKRKGFGFSTSTHVKISRLNTGGRLFTSTSNLTTLRQEREAADQLREQELLAQASAIHQRLAENALEIGANVRSVLDDYDDFTSGQPADHGTNVDSGDDEDQELDDGNTLRDDEKHIVYQITGTKRRRDQRSRLTRNRRLWSAWANDIEALTNAFLQWKHTSRHRPEDTVETDQSTTASHRFQITVVGVFEFESCRVITQLNGEPANVALLRAGYLGCSPMQPTVAIGLKTLELYHQIRRRHSSFSTQSMAKVLCAMHGIVYNQTFRNQLSIAFDVYLDILRHVDARVNRTLGRDAPTWQIQHGCPACANKLPGETTLVPDRIHGMDGNNSLKRIKGSGHADERVFDSPFFLSPEYVDQFKDDVRMKPGRQAAATRTQTSPATSDQLIVECADKWGATVAASGPDQSTDLFSETGGYPTSCRHHIVGVMAEMRSSGELAKYPLAIVNYVLDALGDDQAMGHDIACSFQATLRDSSIGEKAKEHRFDLAVNAFHGHAHNRICQLQNHPMYRVRFGLEDLEMLERVFSASNAVARSIRFASHFHYRQFIDLHFRQWNEDRYLDMSKFLINNYKQALAIIRENGPQVEAYKQLHTLSDVDFEKWHDEELQYLQNMAKEPLADSLPASYVEALQALKKAESDFEALRGTQFIDSPAAVRSIVAKRTASQRRLTMALTAVEDLESLMKIEQRWSESNTEYIAALTYISNREFIRAVNELEGLVVQRLFEFDKANLASTGYQMRQHISKAIVRRSGAIRASLERYNVLAPKQRPPRPHLEYSEIAGYGLLGEFELLKFSRAAVLEQPWSSPANRAMVVKYYKLQCARAEIVRLNVEIPRLYEWTTREDRTILSASETLRTSDPALAAEMYQRFLARSRVNSVHRRRLQALNSLEGYTGPCLIPVVDADGDADMHSMLLTAAGDADDAELLPDEDDALNDEGNRLHEVLQEIAT